MNNKKLNQKPSHLPTGSSGISSASLQSGIISIILCCVPWICISCSIMSIILGVMSIASKKSGKGMAAAGIACGIVAFVLNFIYPLILMSVLDALGLIY